jgi:hypothetical protein
VHELIHCYYGFNHKNKVLFTGEKPAFIPVNRIFTHREWKRHVSRSKKRNPVIEGYKYLEYLNKNQGKTYADVAENFGISRARVSQVIAVVTKLPQIIVEQIISEDFGKLRLTERKLRPLTLLENDEEKIENFREMTERLQ